jgi:hypothetical protein
MPAFNGADGGSAANAVREERVRQAKQAVTIK